MGWKRYNGVSKEQYYQRHEVTPPDDMSMDDLEDLPDSDQHEIFNLDWHALGGMTTGKWMIFRSPEEVDDVWDKITKLIDLGKIWKAKVSHRPNEEGTHAIIVYTPNYLDQEDVWRVREILRQVCDATETLFYKPDIYTDRHIYSDNKTEHGMSRAYRYID